MNTVLVGAAVFAVGFAGGIARAADARSAVDLTWIAPDACPSRDAVLGEVERAVSGATTHRVVARADVTELGPERWAVHLSTDVDGVAGDRSIEANSCAALASATALILAWTIGPTRVGGDVRTPAPFAPEGERNPRPLEVRSSSESVRGLVESSGQLDLGMLPNATAAGEVTLGILVGPFRGELSGADWFIEDATGSVGGTHIHLLEGAVRGCIRLGLTKTFELAPCLGAGIAHASSSGFGLNPTYDVKSDWGMLRAETIATWMLVGPIGLRASIGAVAPLVRPPFVVLEPNGQELLLHRAAAVAGRATLGVEVHFP